MARACLPRSSPVHASVEIRKRGCFFYSSFLLARFDPSFSIVLFFLSLSLSLSEAEPDGSALVSFARSLESWFVTRIENNPGKNGERNRSKLSFGKIQDGVDDDRGMAI